MITLEFQRHFAFTCPPQLFNPRFNTSNIVMNHMSNFVDNSTRHRTTGRHRLCVPVPDGHQTVVESRLLGHSATLPAGRYEDVISTAGKNLSAIVRLLFGNGGVDSAAAALGGWCVGGDKWR